MGEQAQHRLGLAKSGVGPRADDAGISGADLIREAEDGAIEITGAAGVAPALQRSGPLRTAGGELHQQLARNRIAHLVQQLLADSVVIDADKGDIACSDGRANRRGECRAQRLQRGCLGGAAIPGGDRMARLEQGGGEGGAHGPEADDREMAHDGSWLC